jgi:two-component system, cell cycle sensor histidine kinase and response regulator CckA
LDSARQYLGVHYGVAAALAAADSADEAAVAVLGSVGYALGWEAGGLWELDEAAGVLRCAAYWHAAGLELDDFESLSRSITFPPGIGLPGRVFASGRPTWIDDVTKDLNFPRASLATRAQLHAASGFPIFRGGEVRGMMEFFRRDAQPPDEDLLETMASIGTHVGQLLERKRGEEALRASEARARAILESALDCVVSMDHEGRIVEFSPAAVRTFGYERDEAVGRLMADLIVPAELRERHRAGLARYLQTGEPRVLGRRIEITALRRDGETFPVELTITRVDLPGPPLFTGYIRDLSETKLLERQFAEAQKLEAVGRLAGGIAHDFNNVMTIIAGYAALLRGRLEAEGAGHDELDEIDVAAERASSLTRQLLAFSRRDLIQPRVFAVNDVVLQAERMLDRLIAEDVEITTRLEPRAGSVFADPGQLEQVILNLAINARDAMPTGGTIRIETASVELDELYTSHHLGAEPGLYVMLAVSDSGVGMDEETQSHLFEPFFTTKEPGKGTGLGLATVYAIVKQAGGSIWVYSEVGHGTSVKVYLPRAVEADAEAPTAPAEQPHQLRGSETVLIAEDEDAVRALLCHLLEAHGYRVLTANGGAEAIRLVQGHLDELDLMITDLVMRDVTGQKLADEVRAIVPGLPILFMSGYADSMPELDTSGRLRSAFVPKPFTAEALARAVRRILDGAQT